MKSGHPREKPDAEWGALLRQTLHGGGTVVDVRSPAEFAKGAIAGAVNIPLFSDGERSEIGTLYKLVGREEAIGKGLDFLDGRLAEFVASFHPYRKGNLLVYCARGGMRSSAVVDLLSARGFRASQLPGGYKAFRNYALSCFEHRLPTTLMVLHGQTGVGKTELLQRLDNSLDLEDCAQHRSSLFGAVNLQPRTQQQFESHLLAALEGLDAARPVWVEGESRKIGSVVMPDALRGAMQDAPCVLVTASLESRVARIVAEYGRPGEGAHAQLEDALRALTLPMGKNAVAAMTTQLRKGEYAPIVERLLREHYDPRYLHSMRNYRYALTVDIDDPETAFTALQKFARSRLAKGAALPDAGSRVVQGA